MANKHLFASLVGALLPATDTRNAAGGKAYARSPKQALAQYAATGCLNGTFYASADEQLGTVLKLAQDVEPAFIAQVAGYARQVGFMKDMPALLLAVLAARDIEQFTQAFPKVCDSAKMLRTFVQILRSGAVGRKSLGTVPKRLVQRWLEEASEQTLLAATVGNDPSLADVVKMVHPKPRDPARRAFYGWLLGRSYCEQDLPQVVRDFEAWKQQRSGSIPDLPFQLLSNMPLDGETWCDIARRAPWQTTRMQLNTFARHGVFEKPGMDAVIAARLRDRQAIARARAFPYQLMVAYRMAGEQIPLVVREALQDAMEIAVEQVPSYGGGVVVCPDVSGSMHWPLTGYRDSATSAVRCIDVAALVAASVLRKNPEARVLPFSDRLNAVRINPRDSIMTNAATLANLPSGGTNCALPIEWLQQQAIAADLVIIVSDNESWIDNRPSSRGTALLRAWESYRRKRPQAKLVCLDLQPNPSVQTPGRPDILNVGGFSDAVFSVIKTFAQGTVSADHWVEVIERAA